MCHKGFELQRCSSSSGRVDATIRCRGTCFTAYPAVPPAPFPRPMPWLAPAGGPPDEQSSSPPSTRRRPGPRRPRRHVPGQRAADGRAVLRGRRRPVLRGPGRTHRRAARPRLRARPRDVAVRRPGGRQAGPDLPADHRLLLPGHLVVGGRGQGAGPDQRGHHLRRRGARRPRAAAARHRQRPTYQLHDARRRDPLADRGRRGQQERRRLPHRHVAPLEARRPAHPGRERAVRRAHPAHPRDPVRQQDLPRLAALGDPGPRRQGARHRERAVHGRLRARRDPHRDARVLAARGGQGAGGRGPHLRHLVAQPVPHALLPDLRHLLLPGVRRPGCRGRRAATRPSPPPRARS